MVKVLLVSATQAEIAPLLSRLQLVHEDIYQLGHLQIRICVTGVGMVNTALRLGMLRDEIFDLSINLGICGTFGIEPQGTVVNVTSDCFVEMGAEDGNNFLTLDELGFGTATAAPLQPFQNNIIQQIPSRRGITVNKVHGNENSIAQLLQRIPAQVESMEGAAFFAAANAMGWTCVQIRAVSNKVERRNRDNWDIPLAIQNLNEVVFQILKSL